MPHSKEQRLQETNEKLSREVESLTAENNALKIERDKAAVDYLTGLPNYNELTMARIEQIVFQAERLDNYTVVFYLDLDGLGIINDTYGHPAGDAALRKVVSSIMKRRRKSDLFIRKSGDEFFDLLVMKKRPDDSQLKELSNEFRSLVAENPLEFDGKIIPLSLSVGCKVYDYTSTVEKELGAADKILYEDKKKKHKQKKKKKDC